MTDRNVLIQHLQKLGATAEDDRLGFLSVDVRSLSAADGGEVFVAATPEFAAAAIAGLMHGCHEQWGELFNKAMTTVLIKMAALQLKQHQELQGNAEEITAEFIKTIFNGS